MACGDLLQHAAARRARVGEAAMAERAVGNHRDAMVLAPGQHGVLDRALLQMVEDLVAGDPALAAGFPGGIEVGHVEVADAPGQDLALLAEPLEAREGVLERVRAGPVQEVAVQPVGAQARERPLAGRHRRRRGRRCWGAPWRRGRPRRAARRWPRRPRSSASPYISAVSIWVMPRSRPRRRAATAVGRCASSIYQVPWPIDRRPRAAREPNGRCSMLHDPGETAPAARRWASGLTRPRPAAIARVRSRTA